MFVCFFFLLSAKKDDIKENVKLMPVEGQLRNRDFYSSVFSSKKILLLPISLPQKIIEAPANVAGK